MKLAIDLIEAFFGARFEPVDPGPGLALISFDGFVYWEVRYTASSLYITADNIIGGGSFPVVEITVFCSQVSASSAGGVGPTLILHPNDANEPSRLVVLTKTPTGRISLSTCAGASPD